MAKKKDIETPIEEMEVEEEVIEEVAVPEPKGVDVEAFIQRKLYAINEMENKALSKVLAERVVSNRKER